LKNYDRKKDDRDKRDLDHILKKYYPYHYEIVQLKAIYNNSEMYTDTSIYRYAILIESTFIGVWRSNAFPNSSLIVFPEQKTEYFDFTFYDRLNFHRFPSLCNNAVLEAGIKHVIAQVNKRKR
jgi:hypothetical protein